MRMRFLFLLFLLLAGLHGPAAAQNSNFTPNSGVQSDAPSVINPYDPKYRPKLPAPPDQDPSLPAGSSWWVYFAGPGLNPGEAILRLMQPVAVSGCMSIDTPAPQVRVDGSRMWIEIKKPRIAVDREMLRGRPCRGNPGFAAADITLSRERPVSVITLRSEAGMDSFDVTMDESRMALTPRSAGTFHPYERPGALTQWFYPDGTVVLSVPRAGRDQDFSGEIAALADGRGLKPLESVLPGFENPPGAHYFVDADGATAAKVKEDGLMIFGTVTRMQAVHGPQGLSEQPENLDIVAQLPRGRE